MKELKLKEKREVKRILALAEEGLTSSQVKTLKEAGYLNVSSTAPYKTIRGIIFDNVFTYFNLIFFILGFLLIFVGAYEDLAFLFVVIINVFIGIFQQVRSKIKIDKLNLISSLKSVVVRNGKKQTILNSEVVRDDIINFKTGDQINVDAVVLKGQVQVDESLLTGEADPINKTESCELLSGSFVLSGECVARVEKVGDFCYANRLVREAKKDVERKKSGMMNAINTIIKIIGFLIIPFGVILLLKQTFLMHMPYSSSIKATVAVLIGMIPEGLYLLTSIALVVSVLKLMDSKILVHDMSCIETLARVDVICIDKTGTITEPNMKVVGVQKLFSVEDLNFSLEEALNSVVFNMPADNATSKALKEKFKKKTMWNVKKVHPFLSSTKWFGVEFEDYGNFVLGAPEFILKEEYFKIKEEVEKNSKEGKRVLFLANLNGKILNGEINGNVKPLALVLLENPIRSGIYKAFNFFQNEGVRLKVISGDNPAFVFNVCKRAKIKNVNSYVDASKIKDEEELKKIVEEYDIFGRVTPTQKRQIVRILQKEKKHTVAMVGDGVNDVLALRDSDVGVAMLSGSEAANHAAEIVLLNSDFQFMPKIVLEGRRVINNIQRFAALFLVKNIFSFSFAFLALFLKLRFPIVPYQFTIISMLTIGLPAFFLTLEPTTAIVRGSFVKNVFKKAMPGGFCNLIVMILVQIIFNLFSINASELPYVCATLLGVSGLIVLVEICKPLNRLKLAVVVLMSFLMLVAIFFVKDFSNVFELSIASIMVLIFLGVLIKPILKFLMFLFNKLITIKPLKFK